MVQVRSLSESLPKMRSLLIDPQFPFIHRDLSWLQFNKRVLSEALEEENPLFERLKFLSISSSNLDEFFMIRFASLLRSSVVAARHKDKKRAARIQRIRTAILKEVKAFQGAQDFALKKLEQEFSQSGITLLEDRRRIASLFAQRVLPQLELTRPYPVDQLKKLQNLQAALVFEGGHWIPIPKNICGVLTQDGGEKFQHGYCFLDDAVLMGIPELPGLGSPIGIIRVTRDGDLSVDFEEEDSEVIPDKIRTRIRTRDQGRITRIQYRGKIAAVLLRKWCELFDLQPNQIQAVPASLYLHQLWSALNQLPTADKHLRYPPLSTIVPGAFRSIGPRIFQQLKKQDFLLHHPYDSFDIFVNWIRAACLDPLVTQIELTVYRVDAVSPVMEALKRAAKRKRIRVVIELRARFDELNNLRLADDLKNAGVEVAFGFGSLKLHAKVALVTRMEGGKKRYYSHLSTGNYNSVTARQYTDMAILTSHPAVGEDIRYLFDSLFHGKLPASFQVLVPAPGKLHRKLLSHIEAEIRAAEGGRPAQIVAKVNALVDLELIHHLYRASCAGVKIDLIVRGACSLIPGLRGVSENIRVISIVDRFLEHSRIYYFKNSEVIYLSSADWMQRNFFSRLEIAFPVLDPRIYQLIEKAILPVYLKDNEKAWQLTPHGNWVRRSPRGGEDSIRSQFSFGAISA